MPKKKTARKKRAALTAENLKPGVRFKYGGFYGRPSVGVEILRGRESGTGTFGLPQDRWWSRNLDTGEEGYVVLGPGGSLNIDELLDVEQSGAPGARRNHAAKKKSAAQLDREIAEALSQEPSMTTEQIARYRSGRKWGWPADLAFKVATGRPLSRTPGRRSHATMKSDATKTSSVISKVILANRIKTSASFGEPRHYATLVDQATGRTIYKSAVKQTRNEAAALAETFAKRRHLDIVGRV